MSMIATLIANRRRDRGRLSFLTTWRARATLPERSQRTGSAASTRPNAPDLERRASGARNFRLEHGLKEVARPQ